MANFVALHALQAIHDGFAGGYKFLGMFVGLCCDVFQFSKLYVGIDFMYHPILYPLKERSGFCLGCVLLLFSASRYPLCIELKCFCSKSCKDMEVISAVCLNSVQEEPVVKCLLEQGEGMVCIHRVPVICRHCD